APIAVDNQLVAFLAAHHCQEFQTWSSITIKFVTEKAKALGYALSNIVKAQNSESVSDVYSSENGFIPPPPSSSKEVLTVATTAKSQQHESLTMEQEKNDQGNGNGHTKPSEQKTKIQENTVKLFSEISNQIANELGQENILNTTVLELRHLLKCDRVLVYSLDQDNYGVIIAESVAAGLTRALGRTIDDPCFAARYIEKYTQGRVRAWNNVYCEDATPCYLEQLEALGVKAKVVAPIIRDNQLFGLLIAHQCSDTRNWQEQEINWITEIATQVGLMLEYNRITAETAKEEEKLLTESESKWSQHFTEAIQYIRQSLNPEAILKASVKEVRRVLNCDRVVIYSMNLDNQELIVAESVATGWKKIQGKVIKDPCFEAKYFERYRNGRVRAWSNIYESGLTQCYIEQLEELEVKANLVTPIINEGQLFGLLVAHQCSDFRNWQQPEIRWVAQIATQVGFALDNAKLLADAKQLQQQLANEAQLTKYFTDATCYIRESLHQEDILEVSVEEVRRVLNCDRVVIYSMNPNNYGMIVAESVNPGWTRSLGRVINDPCFKVRYIDHYRSGRVRAWGNIYESGLTQCYIEQLEQLEIKANLAIPIISEGQLFGLLF
ncbi:MAG: GAF domain-containing protein, partial [Waterburya sp.]